MSGSGAGTGEPATVPTALVVVGAVLLTVALFLPWYGGEGTPIECLRAPCPEPVSAFNAWQAFPVAAAVLTTLAVVEVAVTLGLKRVRAVPIMVCLLAIASVATLAFAVVQPVRPPTVTSVQAGFAVAVFACGTSGLGGLLAQINRRHAA
ncbi:MAG: hypothetical protein M3137_10205 [Actinomycetota bacterium]|nr:hypothetical protein [Actinomycetota bacterium]